MMYTREKIDDITKESLIEWKESLEHEIAVLEKALDELKVKEIKLNAKLGVAYKAYSRVMDENIQTYVYEPLKQEVEEFRSTLDEKITEKNRRISALGTVILNIEAKLNVMQ
jgi:predicted  nucleic acid-binding Zn-ribbon protein